MMLLSPSRFLLVAALILAVGVPQGLPAQTTLEIVPGSRIRVTAPALGLENSVGVVEEAVPDGILVRFGAGRDSLHFIDDFKSAQMELSVRRKTHRTLGFVVGMAAGALAGWMSGSGLKDDPPCPYRGSNVGSFDLSCLFYTQSTAEEKRQMRAVSGGSIGASIGFLIGWVVRTDVWVPLPWEGSALGLRPSVSGGDGQLVLGFSLRTPQS